MPSGGYRPGAGRKKGVPNKDTQALQDRIASKYPGWDPVEAMAEIAQDEQNDVMIRLAALKEVSQYIHPKRKAIEHTGTVTLPNVTINVPPAPDGTDEPK